MLVLLMPIKILGIKSRWSRRRSHRCGGYSDGHHSRTSCDDTTARRTHSRSHTCRPPSSADRGSTADYRRRRPGGMVDRLPRTAAACPPCHAALAWVPSTDERTGRRRCCLCGLQRYAADESSNQPRRLLLGNFCTLHRRSLFRNKVIIGLH